MMSFSSLIASLGLGLAVVFVINGVLNASKSAKRPARPPGPKGLPLVGNLNDLPKPGVLEAHHWLKHKELYGPISSVTVMGQTLVIINDARIAFELLEKRSVKHSSRPRQIFAGEMLGWENSLGLSQYNDRFRTYRKNMSRIIGSKPAAAQYNMLQEAEVGHFLLHVLDNPDGLVDHIRKEAGAVILKIAYGYTAEPFKNDVLIDMAGDAMDKFARAGVPGAFMVDMMPFLKYLPDWIPGTGFKRIARQWGAELTDVTEKPYAFVKHQMAQGKDDSSFLSRLLEAGDSSLEERFTNKWSAMSLYTAGADTTVSALACFFLAMTEFPDIQRTAQQEIDRVVGHDRLPTASDRQNLPYIEAMVKEVLRWHPVAPMGLPHTSTADDICEGYLIPKGSMLLANVWHFTHDPDVYEEPMSFNPERFLAAESHEPAPDPHTFVFGFGRRICPGRILVDNALYLNIAQSLAVFNISKNMEDGQGVERKIQFTPGVVSHPEPFNAVIEPRSPHHEKLIRSIEFPWQESDARILESMKY
ncbi:O-methylsterigmatocystin oxidoreductase [Phialemonium atrogriseum]|uniref:O-methylsterigmatocystin oxidoreductase n=1 Tax=Phialemonium atrogriseum TaxID=1093897 RepID=A0AAJ0BVB1_9PEZI|nr:O-methylsterigmatocystin oxidoreductase [Phialemonium atrogriseum]KAK1765144.1 O-methylsterigmatocystin oxidoreductase [Phialemonium atrogriseum]